MSEVLIKRLQEGDKKDLKRQLDSQHTQLHGFYYVCKRTSGPAMQQIYRMSKAKGALRRQELYQVVTPEFTCKYLLQDWEGYDVSVSLRLRIKPKNDEDGFSRWLVYSDDVWNRDNTLVFAPALEAALQTDTKYGLDAYVRACLCNVKLELLKKNGAESFPMKKGDALRAKWLEVIDVEDLCVTAHETIKQPIAICEGVVLYQQYRIIRELGHGAMGKVWLAEGVRWKNKKFAIKELFDNVKIMQEVDTLRNLSHDNIVPIRDCDADRGLIVLDYIEGSTLFKYLANKGGKLSSEETKRILLPIARAIDYAHDKPVFHRDIKPDNIMIEEGGNGVLKPYIVDFGLARKKEDTKKLSICGTPVYMPRELLEGEVEGLKTLKEQSEALRKIDVYSFAATAYQCLTGTLPFDGQMKKIVDPAILPDPLDSGIPYGQSIMRGLSKDPNLRPKRCVELFNPSPVIRPIPPKPYEDVKPKVPKPKPPVKQPLDSEIYLEYSILRDYRSMLRNCGMDGAIKKMNDFVKYIRSRDVWHVIRMEAFLDFIESMPAFADVVQEKNMARASRHNLKCWFDNKGWSDTSRLADIRTHYGDSRFAILNAIYDSITRSNQEN